MKGLGKDPNSFQLSYFFQRLFYRYFNFCSLLVLEFFEIRCFVPDLSV